MAIVRPFCLVGELTEYERHWNFPSTGMPMPMYWPGRWSQRQPHPGRITRVAASSVSGTTFSTRPRSSREVQSGLSRRR